MTLAEQLLTEKYTGDSLEELLESLTESPIQVIKERIARWIIRKLGFNPESPLAQVIVNYLGEFDSGDIRALFKGDLEGIVEPIVGAITETLVEQIPEMLGIDPEGFIAQSIQETLIDVLTTSLNHAITKKIT